MRKVVLCRGKRLTRREIREGKGGIRRETGSKNGGGREMERESSDMMTGRRIEEAGIETDITEVVTGIAVAKEEIVLGVMMMTTVVVAVTVTLTGFVNFRTILLCILDETIPPFMF